MKIRKIKGLSIVAAGIAVYTCITTIFIWGMSLLFPSEGLTRTLFFVAGFYFYMVFENYLEPILDMEENANE